MQAPRISLDLQNIIDMQDMVLLEVVPAEDSKDLAELSFLYQCLLVDPISVFLSFEHLCHLLQAYVSAQFFSFPVHDLHKLIKL